MSTTLSAPQSPLVPQQQPLCDDWKQEITERLGRYRAHRPQTAVKPVSPVRTSVDSRATKIARAVAARYAAAPTYSELLAAETARAEALAAEQQRAQRTKQTAAETAGNLFQDLDASDSVQPSPPCSSTNSADTSAPGSHLTEGEEAFLQRYGSAIVTQSMRPPVPATAVMPHFAARSREMHLHQPEPEPEPSLEDLLASALIEPRALLPSKLIEFPRELISSRRARPRLPEDPTRVQASCLQEQQPAQLRIFEVQPQAEVQPEADAAIRTELEADVEPPANDERKAGERTGASAQMSLSEMAEPGIGESGIAEGVATGPVVDRTALPATREDFRDGAAQRPAATASQPNLAPNKSGSSAAAPKTARAVGSAANTTAATNFRGLEWASISLDKEPVAYSRPAQTTVSDYMPFMVDPASIDRRVMAFAVDFALVTAGFLAFLVVFVASTPHLPHGLTALALAGAVYIALWVLYQMLFFSLSGATAGMLYAHIALCTFDDQNPTRSALQWRVGTWWLSMLPLGIGFLWCFVDEDSLCWHDRITRTYQREY